MATSADDFARQLRAARQGDPRALAALLESARAYLLVVARGAIDPLLQAKASGNDLVQEAFLETLRIFERFTGNTEEEFLAWIREIVLNKGKDFRRRFRGAQSRQVNREQSLGSLTWLDEPRGPIPGTDLSPSSQAQVNEEERVVARALARLPDHYQQVIRLRTWEKLTFAEVGSRLGRTEDAVRMLWARAIDRLGQELEGQA